MIKRLILALLAVLAGAVRIHAQAAGFTSVQGQITDPNGNFYAGCTGNASYVPSPSATLVPTIGGSTFPTVVVINQCDSSGRFSIVLADNNVVLDGHTSPPASQWNFAISSPTGVGFQCPITITGATQNVSVPISACAPLLPNGGSGGGNLNSMRRLNIQGATALKASDFSFSSCWGTGASIGGITGTDTSFSFTMTAGSSPCMEPTVKLTFHDGPWNTISSVVSQVLQNSTGAISDAPSSNNLASLTLTYDSLPIAGQTYTITATVSGSTNPVIPLPTTLNPVIQNPTGPQTITGSLTVTGTITGTLNGSLNGTANVYNLNDTVVVDGCTGISSPKYACSVAGIIAALSDPLCASGSCRIQLPPGTYSAASPTTITISQPKIVLEGMGPGTIITMPGAAYPNGNIMIKIAGANSRVTNLALYGQAVDQTTNEYGIDCAANNCEVDHILFSGSGSQALNSQLECDLTTPPNGFNFHDNVADRSPYGTTQSTGYGVVTNGATNGRIHHNTFNWSNSQGRHCFYLSTTATYTQVDHNTCTGGTNIQIHINATDSQGSGAQFNTIDGNTLYGSNSSTCAAICIVNNATYNKVTNNLVISPNSAGIEIWDAQNGTAAHTPDHNDIIGNTVINSGSYGILAVGANNTLIEANKIYNSSQAANGTYSNIYVGGDTGTDTTNNTRIIGNFSFYTGSGTGPNYSLLINSTFTPVPVGTQVIGNTFDNGTVGALNDGGNSSVIGTNVVAGVQSSGHVTYNVGATFNFPRLLEAETSPTIVSGFGTSPSVISGGNGTASFAVNVGTGGTASSGVIGFPTAPNAWVCSIQDTSTINTSVFLTKQISVSASQVTIANFNTAGTQTAWGSGDILHLQCSAH